MKREIITIDEQGRLNMPTDTASVWMTLPEIVELFGTTAAAVHTGIKKTPCTITKSANASARTAATVRTCIILKWLSPLHSVFVRRAQRNYGSIYSVHSVQ